MLTLIFFNKYMLFRRMLPGLLHRIKRKQKYAKKSFMKQRPTHSYRIYGLDVPQAIFVHFPQLAPPFVGCI